MTRNAPTLFVREWREARHLTQQQLADMIGRDKSVVSKLERGRSGLTSATIQGIAEALAITPGALYEPPPSGTRPVGDDEVGQVGGTVIKKPPTRADGMVRGHLVGERADLPIYASARGGASGMVLTYEPIDWVKRPEPLFNVTGGFGMYVVGDSMSPAYDPGDMILVHPHRPANSGDDVLVVKKSASDDFEALVKRLVKSNANEIRLKQFNPPETFDVATRDVHAVYLIVGRYNKR